MSYQFSLKSLENLSLAHEKLQIIAIEMIKEFDFSIICSYRNEQAQNDAYANGYSELKWPKSAHNHLPSLAIDCTPFPLDWKNIESFKKMRRIFYYIADDKNIKIKPLIKFKNGGADYPHFELDL